VHTADAITRDGACTEGFGRKTFSVFRDSVSVARLGRETTYHLGQSRWSSTAPPDRVLLMIGASFQGEPLRGAALRLAPLVTQDAAELQRYGIEADADKQLHVGARPSSPSSSAIPS